MNEADSVLYILLCVLEAQSVEVRGRTASGKGTICDEACEYLPQQWWKKITGLSDKALRHLPDTLRLIYIAERKSLRSGSADEESTAETDVKLMISEGKLKVLIAVRNTKSPTGFTTIEREIVVGMFLVTTTSEISPEEYENRFHIVNSRQGERQNQAVVASVLTEAQTLPWERADHRDKKQLVRSALPKIDDEASKAVVIPFASAMLNCFDMSRDHIRRNVKKLISLVHGCARMHYKQRPTINSEDGSQTVLVAFPEDLLMVLRIGERNLDSTFNVLSRPSMDTLNACKKLYDDDHPITAKTVTEGLNVDGESVSEPAVRKRLKGLYSKGYLGIDESTHEEPTGKIVKTGKGRPSLVYLPLNFNLAPSLGKLSSPERVREYEKALEDCVMKNWKTIIFNGRKNMRKSPETADSAERSVFEGADPFTLLFTEDGFQENREDANGGNTTVRRRWVDPLDGTINFIDKIAAADAAKIGGKAWSLARTRSSHQHPA